MATPLENGLSMSERAATGWDSSFEEFREAPPKRIHERLRAFVRDASDAQLRTWSDAIPLLQSEVSTLLIQNELARDYFAILEYEMPMESRRADVVLLVGPGVMVIELKGKLYPSQADLDQAAAYARDLHDRGKTSILDQQYRR